MIFTELRFLAFLALVVGVHWTLRGRRARQVWLLLASYAFYASWDARFLLLILASTIVDYSAALGINAAATRGGKRAWLCVSLATNLGLLGVFKYLDFFRAGAADLLRVFGFEPGWEALGLILPVGISFYTFQTLSYTIDVYRGRLAPRRNPLELALFVAFFPQLVAGPIVRAADFLPQLDRRPAWSSVAPRAALSLFLVGFVKKACISDALAPLVDAFYADPGAASPAAAWTALVAFSAQIYCDFSAYSDMALACAALLGYRLPLNFDFPFLAADLRDFWRRWHMTLSSWVRDYVYRPMGGGHGSGAAVAFRLLVSMGLLGLWHGAAWTFVLLGLLHGAGLAAQSLWERRAAHRPLPAPIGQIATFVFVTLSLVLFRAADLAGAGQVFAAAFGAGTLAVGPAASLMGPCSFLLLLACAHGLARDGRLGRAIAALPTGTFALLFGAASATASAFAADATRPFVYFQF